MRAKVKMARLPAARLLGGGHRGGSPVPVEEAFVATEAGGLLTLENGGLIRRE